jgi:hypothetical protein
MAGFSRIEIAFIAASLPVLELIAVAGASDVCAQSSVIHALRLRLTDPD